MAKYKKCEDEEDSALEEVYCYYRDLHRIMMGVKEPNKWYMKDKNRGITKRRHLECTSLELSTGKVCGKKVAQGVRYCKYHSVQHDVMCREYHVVKQDGSTPHYAYLNNEKLDVLNDSSRSFMEFFLRKEFDIIEGFNDKSKQCDEHAERYVYLMANMFDAPYPKEHVDVVCTSFTRDAKWKQQCLQNERACKKIFYFVLNYNQINCSIKVRRGKIHFLFLARVFIPWHLMEGYQSDSAQEKQQLEELPVPAPVRVTESKEDNWDSD